MALFLFAFWLVLNGGARMDVVLTGIVITGAVLVFACKYLDWSLRREAVVYLAAPRALVYLGLLLEEIVKANIAVGKLLIAGKPKAGDPHVPHGGADAAGARAAGQLHHHHAWHDHPPLRGGSADGALPG